MKELSGKVTLTSLSFAVRHIVEFKKASLFFGFFAVCCCVWAVIERELRKRQIERFHGTIKELELRLDPNRTSSNLTIQGDTNPEDLL